jgi:hypothetical protein
MGTIFVTSHQPLILNRIELKIKIKKTIQYSKILQQILPKTTLQTKIVKQIVNKFGSILDRKSATTSDIK